MAARGDHVGLDEAFVGRARGGERGDAVIGGSARRVVVGHRTDRDHVGGVAGHRDRLRGRTEVAGRGDDDDARLPELHDRLVDRVVPVERLCLGAERQVQHADVVRGLLRQNPVEACDHVRVSAGTIGAEGPDPHQLCIRCHALGLAAIRCVTVHDDGRHVRAVTDRVVGRRGGDVRNRVVGPENPVVIGRILDHGQGVVGVADAGVDDGHRHTRAIDALRVQLRHAHDRHVPCVGSALRDNGGIREEAQLGRLAQPRGLRGGEFGGDAINDRQLIRHPATDRAHRAGGRLRRLRLHDEAAARLCRLHALRFGRRELAEGEARECSREQQ